MSLLEKAIAISVEAHQGKKDRAGQPYILHPLRVLFGVETDDESDRNFLFGVVGACPDGWGCSSGNGAGVSPKTPP